MQPGNFDFAPSLGTRLRAHWSDRQQMILRDEEVELVQKSSWNWIVICPVCIREQTQVYLTTKNYTGNGIVYLCEKDDLAYILTLSMMTDASYQPLRHEFDPGVLGVDSFLTEEEESKILEGVNDETPFTGMLQRVVLGGVRRLCHRTRHSFLQIRHKALLLFLPVACF